MAPGASLFCRSPAQPDEDHKPPGRADNVTLTAEHARQRRRECAGTCHYLCVDGTSRISVKAEIERVNLLHAAITHQERRVIRRQSYPAGEHVSELRKIL